VAAMPPAMKRQSSQEIDPQNTLFKAAYGPLSNRSKNLNEVAAAGRLVE
jgi:hypothetical protein